MQSLLDFVVKHDLKQQWMVKVLGFSTRDSTRSTTRAALRSPPRLFWRMLQHCYPCDCEGSAPTHPHTHPRTHVHARTHPSTHGHFFFPLSLFLLSSSERGQRQREGARRRRLYGCSAAGGEAAADIRLQSASTRALLEATFVLTVLGASCRRKR